MWARAGMDSNKFEVTTSDEALTSFLDRTVIEFIDEMNR